MEQDVSREHETVSGRRGGSALARRQTSFEADKTGVNPAPTQALRRTARLAGGCYLMVAVLGGFAELYVRARVYAPDDAMATLSGYQTNVGLVRLGIAADLIQAVFFLALSMLLYRILHRVNGQVAAVMVVLVAISAGIITLNMVFQQGALVVATDPAYASGVGGMAQGTLVLLLTDLQYYGYLIAGIFFALWLLPLGYLAIWSGLFPRVLGIGLMIACVGYLIETFTMYLAPIVGELIDEFVTIPAGMAEMAMMVYLLIVGVRDRVEPRSSASTF